MPVILAYRRQRLLHEICRHVGYHGRYVWLIGATDLTMKACRFMGDSRIRYRVLDITLVPIFEPHYRPIPQEEDKHIELGYNEVCVALPIIRRRRRILLMFMDVHRLMSWRWSSVSADRLSPEEYACLRGDFKTYDEATTAVAETVCEFRCLLYQRQPTPIGLRLKQLIDSRHRSINNIPLDASKIEAIT